MFTFARKPKVIRRTVSLKTLRPGRACLGQAGEANLILRLQRAIGNQAVQRGLEENTADVKGDSTSTEIARSSRGFSGISMCPFVVGAIQAKLAINKPGDQCERQADRVVDRVMRMEQPATRGVSTRVRCVKAGEETLLQARAASGFAAGIGPVATSGLQSLQGSGKPLGASESSFFEPRFGTDFSEVRVHLDSRATDLARSMNARAFTLGKDIVFDAGQYAPGTNAGRRLLAHELTHTLQQKGSGPAVIQRSPNSVTMPHWQPLAGQGSVNYLVGILTEMYVGSNQTCDRDYDGETIEEEISTISNSCGGSLGSHTTTFTVGAPYSSRTFGTFPGRKNTFYDGHVMGIHPSRLPAYGGRSCSIVDRQIYKYNGTPIAEYRLTRTAGQPGAGNRANLTTVKTEVNDCLSCP